MKKKATGRRLSSGQRKGAVDRARSVVPAIIDEADLLSDLRSLIQSARQRIASAAFATQTLLCWHLGPRLLNENLQGSRAEYGRQILVTVSRELTAEYGHSFDDTANAKHDRRSVAEACP